MQNAQKKLETKTTDPDTNTCTGTAHHACVYDDVQFKY